MNIIHIRNNRKKSLMILKFSLTLAIKRNIKLNKFWKKKMQNLNKIKQGLFKKKQNLNKIKKLLYKEKQSLKINKQNSYKKKKNLYKKKQNSY